MAWQEKKKNPYLCVMFNQWRRWPLDDRKRLQSSQDKRTPQDSINEFIIRKLNPLVVVDFRFISAFLHL